MIYDLDHIINDACVISEGWCASALSQMLHGIPSLTSFELGKIDYFIPKSFHGEINSYVRDAIHQSVIEALKKIEPEIRKDERAKIALSLTA